MHIYAFGSLCRGEIDINSDVDLLAIVSGSNPNLEPKIFSIYSYRRLKEIWEEGNPFAWHLFLESALVYSDNGVDFILSLNKPAPYKNCFTDCSKFYSLFERAFESIMSTARSRIFDLSVVFLSIRNFATCFSLTYCPNPVFSRNSALLLGDKRLPISAADYLTFERARILSTRGVGQIPSAQELESAIQALPIVKTWMGEILIYIKPNE